MAAAVIKTDLCLLDLAMTNAAQQLGIPAYGCCFGMMWCVHQEAQSKSCGELYWTTHETNATAQKLYNAVAEKSGFIKYKMKL